MGFLVMLMKRSLCLSNAGHAARAGRQPSGRLTAAGNALERCSCHVRCHDATNGTPYGRQSLPLSPPLACLQVIAAADALMTFKLSIKL